MNNPLSDELYHSRKKTRKPDLRGDYFRDQTAIIHATPFRRLKHKTQVFFSPKNDHICTRIEHVLHVSTIATTICKGLGLDVELAQAISLGHDLGHAPFGHIGEKTLHELASYMGGFIHEVHGLRVVDKLTRDGKGLNLTYAVRDGIVSHCGEEFQKSISPEILPKDLEAISSRQSAPSTYEGCVVRVADKIAYLGRDIEDAITTGLITGDDIPPNLKRNLGNTNGEIIDTLVLDVVKHSMRKNEITFSSTKFDLICQLKNFNYKHIYNHPMLIKSDQSITSLISHIYNHLQKQFRIHQFKRKKYMESSLIIDAYFGQFLQKRKHLYTSDPHPERCVVDFVAGMTDTFALESANETLFPQPVGIHPI